ncbi:hypothetical protein NQ318_010669 [Aromia moschata]|uniref:Uncharacterized protein n=1 Tax=Aromia moschata TaxID=1265417 RepID=A0AAV8XTQ6_9CUCU|nr:hypothetical protein NQ318_010669 [Aromia moschata]
MGVDQELAQKNGPKDKMCEGCTDTARCVMRGPDTHRTSRCASAVSASAGTARRRLLSRRKLRSAGAVWNAPLSTRQMSLLPTCLAQQCS